MKKVSIIGAGNVGATAAYFIAREKVADLVLIDVVEGLPESKTLDFLHALLLQDYNVSILGTTDYAHLAHSDIVVLTAGIARKPGMDRMDLLRTNVNIARKAAAEIARHASQAVVIVVTNPLDVISMVVLKETNFAVSKVVGMAGVLDATRFQYFISQQCGVWPGDVMSMVLGGHGDSMVPLKRYTSIGGMALNEMLDDETVDRLIERTRKGGAEIISYFKTGSAYYAPGASAAKMVLSIIRNDRRVIPASVYLRGEYGYHDIFLGVPIILGGNGVERIIEIELSDAERQALERSVQTVREGLQLLESEIDEKL